MDLKIGCVLNGPPGCGKDTIANMLAAVGCKKHQFKDALYAKTAEYFKVDLDMFIHYASERSLKDSKSLAGLGGRTPRQALIHVSEDICKPQFGNDYFGNLEAARLEALYGSVHGPLAVVYPDGGFADEVKCVESFFDAVIVVRLHRAGYDFSNDSRDYILLPSSSSLFEFDVYLDPGNEVKGAKDVVGAIWKTCWIKANK